MKQFLCVLIAFVVASCYGQTTTPDLDALAKEGIDPYFVESSDTISIYGPDHITRDVVQDKNGNYWFATWLGIIQYDGTHFTNYTL
jgi:ligand-binding sensor domain-containing protein